MNSVDNFAAPGVILQIKRCSCFVLIYAGCVRKDRGRPGEKRQTACKPGSVLARRRGWPFIWDARRRTPRATDPDSGAETRLNPKVLPSLLGLAPGGVYPAAAVTGSAVRSYRTISPLPPRKGTKPLKGLAVCFCGTFPRVAPAGRYPAPCFRGARTFLPRLTTKVAIRPSGLAIKPCGGRRVKPPLGIFPARRSRSDSWSRGQGRRRSAPAGNGAETRGSPHP